MIAFASIDVGSGGLPSCARCAPRERFAARDGAEIVAEIERAASSWPSAPGPNISLDSAEALSHPELPQLIVAARSAGAERIRLATSGAALGAYGNATGALDAGVRHLEVTLLASGDDHDRLADAPGEFAAVEAGLRAWREAAATACARTATVARVPVCRHNLELLAPLLAKLPSLGILAVTLDVSDAAAGSVGASKWLDAALDSATTAGVWATMLGADALAIPALHRVSVLTELPNAGAAS